MILQLSIISPYIRLVNPFTSNSLIYVAGFDSHWIYLLIFTGSSSKYIEDYIFLPL